MTEVTQLLDQMADGSPSAAERLFPLVYDELRALAGSYFRGERPDHTLQPTALVNEAFVRLAAPAGRPVRGREHFLALAARVMRHVLVDHARERNALRRGGDDRHRVLLSELETSDALSESNGFDIEAVDAALTELATLNDRSAQVVELRFFGGLTHEEIARAIDASLSTVEREWRFARAWLLVRLETPSDGGTAP